MLDAMRTRTCDMCCEPVGEYVVALQIEKPRYKNFDLCEVCALPIVKLLRQQGLIPRPVPTKQGSGKAVAAA